MEGVVRHSVHTLVFRSLKRTHDMFLSEEGQPINEDDKSLQQKITCKVRDEYDCLQKVLLPSEVASRLQNIPTTKSTPVETTSTVVNRQAYPSGAGVQLSLETSAPVQPLSGDVMPRDGGQQVAVGHSVADIIQHAAAGKTQSKELVAVSSNQLMKRTAIIKPTWHPPWKLMRVISGHLGWVRCVTVDPSNTWFATGSSDRTIKIWELGSCKLKLSLTGHISSVRGLAVSSRQPYLFSCGEDKQVKCWDLEMNKVVRHYHGHLSGVYDLSLHPTIDILVTCGRDASARVWDMRTKACIHTLTGHTNTVACVKCQAANPQVITGSHDSTIRLWDLAAGKTKAVLTNHKKSVRSIVLHPTDFSFASASPDNIKQWKFPDGNFIQNLSGHQSIVNSLAANQDGVLVSAADNGTLHFWDWKTGYNFQKQQTVAQPGSLDSEAGIFATTFDLSGCRLITAEADKTIKIYKEDDSATEETHPINWKADVLKRKRY